MQWQPIETAPKDGVFLVYLAEPYLRQSRVQVMIKHPNVTFIGGSFHYDAPKPTHWMPLPPPPQP